MTHPFQVIRIMRDGSETTVHSCNSSHEASTACDTLRRMTSNTEEYEYEVREDIMLSRTLGLW